MVEECKETYMKAVYNLMSTIEECVSPFHVVKRSTRRLLEAGFTELKFKDEWKLEKGNNYFVNIYDSSIVAFTVGNGEDKSKNIRIATAHNDFPCLRIKPDCEIKESGYLKLNVEVYGGVILNTWLDRPLSISGKVVISGENDFEPQVKFIDFARPLLTIPNLAPHINRELNKGYEYNKQKDMLPVIDIVSDKINEKGYLQECIAKELNVKSERILDMELVVYQYEKGCLVGMENTMLSAPRLDNLTSVEACLYGIINATRNKGINMIAMFDNEEIGSRSKQGAGSMVLSMIVEKIYLALGYSREKYISDIADGIIVSADVSHCVHPNYTEKNDITLKSVLNGGVVIKKASNQSYANDSEGVAIVKSLCKKAGVKYQLFANRSDGTGGGTLGSIVSTLLPMRTIDVGVPLLAMHSARELMGVEDQNALNELIKALFA